MTLSIAGIRRSPARPRASAGASAGAIAIIMLLGAAPVQACIPFGDPASTDSQPPSLVQAVSAVETAPLPSTAPVEAPSSTEQVAPAPDSAAEIVVTARQRHSPADPFQKANALSFAATEAVDRAVIGPVALAFEHIVPAPARSGLRNALNNIHEPVVFLNFVLQHKAGKALETFARFAINSTIGLAGLFDIAKRRPFKLRLRRNGFADTLGYYGVKPGAYLFVPVVGPTTVRDLAGDVFDRLVMPLAFGRPFNRLAYTIPTSTVGVLDRRAQFDDQLNRIRDSADPYVARRDFYLEKRRAEIQGLHGKHRRAVDDGSEPSNPSSVPADPAASGVGASTAVIPRAKPESPAVPDASESSPEIQRGTAKEP